MKTCTCEYCGKEYELDVDSDSTLYCSEECEKLDKIAQASYKRNKK